MGHGVILTLKDTIAECSGLNFISSGELVRDVSKFNYGMALNLQSSQVGAVMFSEKGLKQGYPLYRTSLLAKTYTSMFLSGFVLNVLGLLLNKGPLLDFLFFTLRLKNLFFTLIFFITNLLENRAPGILKRQSIYESVNTGIKVIDGLIPLGQGQRELIIGDRQTGKTAIAVDSILNQARISIIFLK